MNFEDTEAREEEVKNKAADMITPRCNSGETITRKRKEQSQEYDDRRGINKEGERSQKKPRDTDFLGENQETHDTMSDLGPLLDLLSDINSKTREEEVMNKLDGVFFDHNEFPSDVFFDHDESRSPIHCNSRSSEERSMKCMLMKYMLGEPQSETETPLEQSQEPNETDFLGENGAEAGEPDLGAYLDILYTTRERADMDRLMNSSDDYDDVTSDESTVTSLYQEYQIPDDEDAPTI